MSAEYKLLADIEEAEELHREVVAKWRWVHFGIPASTVGFTAGAVTAALGGAIGPWIGSLGWAIIVVSFLVGCLCMFWFICSVPRNANGLVHPGDSAKKVREARRKHVEYTLRNAS